MNGLPADFFTRESVLSFLGVVAATHVVANAVQAAFGVNPRWLALAIAVFLCLAGTTALDAPGFLDYVLAVVNGCLVFLTAAGGTAVSARRAESGREEIGPSGARRRRFTTPWF